MKGFDLSNLRINPNNPYPFSGSDTEWADFKKKLDRDPEFMEANKIAFDSSRDNLIIAGNKRVQALRELGWKMIPDKYVIDCKDWSEEKRERYIYASNWNIGQWSVEFTDEEQAEEWGIRFEEEEEIHIEAKEDEYVPPAEIQTDIVKGDLFELRKGDLCHRLLCGDSTDSDQVAKLMNGEKADMVFTDPPYGVSYEGINNDDRSGLKDLLRGSFANMMASTKNGGSFYCFHSDKCSDIFSKVFREFCHFSSMIIWVKESIVLSQTDYQSKHEPCMYGWFNNGTHKWYSDRKQESVWLAKSKREEGHTTPKPIEIISKALNNSSQEKHLVLDLFFGSGSTMVAAHQLKRKCYGIEIDEKYCQVGIDRMLKLDKDIQLFRNGKDVTEKYRKRLRNAENMS